MTKRLCVVGVSGPVAVGKSLVTSRLCGDAAFALAISACVDFLQREREVFQNFFFVANHRE
mgnify:CR=1 FL=1